MLYVSAPSLFHSPYNQPQHQAYNVKFGLEDIQRSCDKVQRARDRIHRVSERLDKENSRNSDEGNSHNERNETLSRIPLRQQTSTETQAPTAAEGISGNEPNGHWSLQMAPYDPDHMNRTLPPVLDLDSTNDDSIPASTGSLPWEKQIADLIKANRTLTKTNKTLTAQLTAWDKTTELIRETFIADFAVYKTPIKPTETGGTNSTTRRKRRWMRKKFS